MLLSLRCVDFRVVLSEKCKVPDKESRLASGTWSNVLAQLLSDHTDSLLLVSIPVSLYFLLWYCSLAGDLLDFFWSSQKLRLDLFSWETWEIRIGVYISHSMTLNLKGKISSESINAKFSFHPVFFCVGSHKCDTCHVMSQRNNLACDSAPLVCRDPLPFGIYCSFTACGVGYPMILPLLMAWKWAVKNSTTLRMWVQPWESLILATWDWLVWVQLSFPGGHSCLCPHCSPSRAKPCWWSVLEVSCVTAQISVKNKPCLCQRSKIFQQNRKHFSIPQVLLFPWWKSQSESPWSQNQTKAQHGVELDDPCWSCPTQDI